MVASRAAPPPTPKAALKISQKNTKVRRQNKQMRKGTKPVTAAVKAKPKESSYTDAQLGIAPLNTITPVGVQRVPKRKLKAAEEVGIKGRKRMSGGAGKKRNKIYVEDRQMMMWILAEVNAVKEGEIVSKLEKAKRQEDIREARREAQEAKEEVRKGKLEETKDSFRRKRKRTKSTLSEDIETVDRLSKKKSVRFV